MTFNELKQEILTQELEFREALIKDDEASFDPDYEPRLKSQFQQIVNIPELVGWYQGEGFDDWEAYEQIIKILLTDETKNTLF